jgi:hypothetical protein
MNFLIDELYSKFYGNVSDTDTDDDLDTDTEDTVGKDTVVNNTVGTNTVGDLPPMYLSEDKLSKTVKVETSNTVIEKPSVVCKCDVSTFITISQFRELSSKMDNTLKEYKTTQDKLKGELSKCIYNIRELKKTNRIRINLLNYLLYMSNFHSVMCLVCTNNTSSHNCRMSYTLIPRFRSGGGSVFNYNSLTTFVMGLDDNCLNYFSNVNLQYINDRLSNYNNNKESDKYVIFNEALETDKLVYNLLWKVKKNV